MANYENPFLAEKKKEKKIYYTVGQPDTIKSDCKVGKFVPLGGDKKTAPSEINMQVLKYADIPNAVLFPSDSSTERKTFTWTQVFFVNDKGVLCSTLLKNESRDNFLKAARNCQIDSEGEKDFTDFIFTAKFGERINARKEEYFAVSFETKAIDAPTFNRNKAWSVDNHESVFDNRVIVEYVKQNLPEFDASQLPEAVAELLFGFGFISESYMQKLLNLSNVTMLEPQKEAA